jgi:hypothetical protein
MKIIKVSLVIVSFFLLSLSANAQASIGIGVKGGLNFAKLDGSSAGAAYNSRTGYHAGAYVRVKLSKIAIQPEVIFSKQGTTVSFSGKNLQANYDYINIPVLLKLYTVAGINLQVGPQFGFLAGAKQDVYDPNTGTVSSQNVKSQLKSSDISAALGLGWDLPFGLSIDARYNLGLTKINNTSGSSAAKNQVIQVSVGYRLFKLGK